MSEANHYLVHRIIEHIREVGLEHDTADIEEFGIMKIIGAYGWHPILSGKEKEILQKDIWDMALRMEVAEVVRSMQGTDEYVATFGDKKAVEVCPEVEVIQNYQEPILA